MLIEECETWLNRKIRCFDMDMEDYTYYKKKTLLDLINQTSTQGGTSFHKARTKRVVHDMFRNGLSIR